MSDESESRTVEHHPPEQAFSLLADETRLAILRELSDADDSLSFSELRARVGVRDSGKFNYHLKKLLDSFVRRDEGGYELTLAGTQVVGALLAGTYTASVSLEPIEIDGDCRECGASLVAVYEDEHAKIRCCECGTVRMSFTFPPGTIEQYDREELPLAFERWVLSEFAQATRGFCPNCSGRLDASLELNEDGHDRNRSFRNEVAYLRYRCGRCGNEMLASVDTLATNHSTVVAFLADRGIDLDDVPSWELDQVLDANETEMLSRDPPRVRSTVGVGGESVALVVDDSGEVVDVERSDA
ncbi:winged helix-turn-helix domain-containing protein [Haloprofundus salinisoli]|uniref:winged helix-turn-helix domain-containing protein n=1 Tax=Haloprofundus salinisoli TaxID=2876193 RepID=UPI001CCB9D48|nr:helix-turn-helix domain-containing protein [Haloprofundus salinisoli]